jgi:hypothetical protein
MALTESKTKPEIANPARIDRPHTPRAQNPIAAPAQRTDLAKAPKPCDQPIIKGSNTYETQATNSGLNQCHAMFISGDRGRF